MSLCINEVVGMFIDSTWWPQAQTKANMGDMYIQHLVRGRNFGRTRVAGTGMHFVHQIYVITLPNPTARAMP